jgi:uridine kinase
MGTNAVKASAGWKPVAVAIAGGSASGKSTLARSIAEALGDFRPVILNQDHYFRDWSEYPPERRSEVRTSNHPKSVLWTALRGQVERLLERQPIDEPASGTSAAMRGRPTKRIDAGDLILVEGHLILGNEPLRELMDLRIYVEVDPHERVLRRMLRDTSHGGMTLDQAVAWYRRDVVPNYPTHTEATRRHADLVVPFEEREGPTVDFLAAGLRGMLADRNRDASV